MRASTERLTPAAAGATLRRMELHPHASTLRERIYRVIFESDTPAGKFFDVVLILCILTSVFVVMLDSVPMYRARHGELYLGVEWFFTLLFTVEYALRLASVRHPWRYARSFFGVIDLISILPTYFSFFITGAQYLLVFRLLRVLRVFRVLRIVPYVGESRMLQVALWNSRRKISVFLLTLVIIAVIMGALIYIIEGEEHGFTSIPLSIYWAIITMTTVGYGDLTPVTTPGRALASVIMIIGYAIIAVPTGIVSVEIARATQAEKHRALCPRCGLAGHDEDARYCKRCGEAVAISSPKAAP